MPLRINLDDLGPEEDEPFSSEGVRVGSLLVSSQGLSTSQGGPSYVLSPADLVMLPEKEGGFLGKGSSGAVWQAVHRRTGTRVAVKEIKVTSQAHLTEIRRELETLYDSTAQASSHMVDFYGAYTYEGSVFIAVECMDGTLADLAAPMPLTVLAHVTRSVLRGLVYLHRLRHLIHRDLKPSNVLFKCATGDVKIADFGVSSNLECTKGDAHSFVGTVTYMSPERLRGDSYSFAADIWSLGLVVAELAFGACPYPTLRSDNVEARFWSLLQHLSSNAPALELPQEADPDLVDFITRCVAKDPDARPSCTTLLNHPFVTAHCAPVDAAASPEALDQEDRDVMRTWLHELTGHEARRRGHRVTAQGTCSPRCDSKNGGGVAAALPSVSPGGDPSPACASSPGCTDGDRHTTRGAPHNLTEVPTSVPGHWHANSDVSGNGFREATDICGDGAGVEDTTTTSEHPVLFRTTQTETEASVNLDEELDKLLL